MPSNEFKKDAYYLVKIIGVIFVALLIALPVAIIARKAANPADALTAERLAAFTSDKVAVREQSNYAYSSPGTSGGYGQRSEKYTNIGEAILTVNIYNITKLTASDFTKIGETPWSLMNTVKGNLNTPQVIDIVFNNKNVVAAFLNRDSVKKLGGSQKEALTLIRLENYTLEKFVTNPTVEYALKNQEVLDIILNSALVNALLQTPTGIYFLQNPQEVRRIIDSNSYLQPLLQSDIVKQALLKNKNTAAAAKQIFR